MHTALFALCHDPLQLAVLLQRQGDGYLHDLVLRKYDIQIRYPSQHLDSPVHGPRRHSVIQYPADLISPVGIEPDPSDIFLRRFRIPYHQQVFLVVSLPSDEHQQIPEDIPHQGFQEHVDHGEYRQHGSCEVILVHDIQQCHEAYQAHGVCVYYVNQLFPSSSQSL